MQREKPNGILISFNLFSIDFVDISVKCQPNQWLFTSYNNVEAETNKTKN